MIDVVLAGKALPVSAAPARIALALPAQQPAATLAAKSFLVLPAPQAEGHLCPMPQRQPGKPKTAKTS